MVTRRNLLKGVIAAPLAAIGRTVEGAAAIQYGYAGITWGNDYKKAIDEIAAVGYRGVQLRSSDGLLDEFGAKPAALRELLAQKHLAFPVFSSGNLSIDPAREKEMIDLHTSHARFVREAGGLFLQIIDERPKRAVVAGDYKRTGQLLTELGKRVQDIGVTVAYHPHMNSTGEKPQELAAVLDAADRRYVRVLFDTAHYQQGGGDPATAIRQYRDWIAVLHLKDVRASPDQASGYQFVELGRGRVDLKAVFAALNEINFKGWGVVELDRVPDAGRTPKESAEMNRQFLIEKVGQKF
ncbi:MAG TPA: sugar phosphate isomerase/epimerase [Vicinamibacterales bacterium]